MRLPEGHRLRHVETIDSTNLEARRLFDAGERGPLWIVADEQTAGRGRLGRTWVSRPGNLYATFLLQSAAPALAASQLSFVAALAVHDTASALRSGASLLLKWPNDVLLEGGKLCGLLAEVLEQQPLAIAMGFGINVSHAPQGLTYRTACIGKGHTAGEVLQGLASAFTARLAEWDEGKGFGLIRQAWLARTCAPGSLLTIDGKPGRFAGLSETGALLLQQPDGSTAAHHAGDVRLEAVPA